MINRLIEGSLKMPGLVIILLLVVIGFGAYSYREMPIDAFPDISPVMVPVFAEGHGMAPEEIERLITYPIESAMNGLPDVTQIKSTSAFGMAVVYVYFEDNVDIYFARQLVAERLAAVRGELPDMDVPPALGPISTGLGQIFIYYLTADQEQVNTGGKPLNTWLRELNDWVVKFQLQTVPGVTDVLSIGGHVLQYQIMINPHSLREYDITLEEVVDAVNDNNRNVGGQFLVLGSEEHLVRGVGLIEELDDLRTIPIKEHNGVPIFIRDIAEVEFGNEVRRGVVTLNGEQEVVSGIVMKLYGENTSEVIERLYKKVEKVKKTLPAGVKLVPYYEQAELVAKATGTVTTALLQGGFLVIIVLIIFLGNWRAATLVALSLPVSALCAIIFMDFKDITGNLMSFGGIAIAIGMLCDGAIVMVESIMLRLSDPKNSEEAKSRLILQAAKSVGRPIFFSGMIVVLVFIPLFTLQGIEGKMFSPMAWTISAAMIGSTAVALMVIPVLALFIFKHKAMPDTWLVKFLGSLYAPLLKRALEHKKTIIILLTIIFALTLIVGSRLGREFMPVLEEGSIFIGVGMSPSISLDKATETVMKLERKIMTFAEVNDTVSRIGRPEAGSHPHPVNTGEIHLRLKPIEQWKNFKTKAALIEAIRKKIATVPGVQFNFTQPIQNAFDELISGVKTQLAIKLYGDDLTVLRNKATEIKEVIENVPGLVDLNTEQSFGQPQIQIIPNRAMCARYGISVKHILELVEFAIGGEVVDNIYLNTRRFGIHIRYQEKYRNDPAVIRNLLLSTPQNGLIPLGQVAEVKPVVGPIQINREKNQRRWVVQGNIRGRAIGSVVGDIQQLIEQKIKLPPGYTIEYGGQFANQQRAMKRFIIIEPCIIIAVLIMLWITLTSVRQALIIFTMVPLSVIGGIWGLVIMGEYLSVPASVGFIALFGMAMLDGLVMIACFNEMRGRGLSIYDAVVQGSHQRLAPVMVTTVTTLLGLLPLLLARGIGAEVQRPLAGVVVFGLATSTILTLFVIPVVYSWAETLFEKKY
jgi:cobalt-zinc-cadmium resistance protein CzcA